VIVPLKCVAQIGYLRLNRIMRAVHGRSREGASLVRTAVQSTQLKTRTAAGDPAARPAASSAL
jgi:hypothetical protein